MDPTYHALLRQRLLHRARRLRAGTAVNADAEDAVQDGWLRWLDAGRYGMAPVNDEAWLVTAVTRLCLDRLRHQTVVRQLTPVGESRPASLDPLMPAEHVGFERDARAALAHALACLSPIEAVVLLLVDVCDLAHREVAMLVDRREETCRQLLRRARQRLRWRLESGSPADRSPAGNRRPPDEHLPSPALSGPVEDSSPGACERPATVASELLDRCLDAIRSADHRALVAAVLRGAPVVQSVDKVRCIVGPQGELTVRLGNIVLATVPASIAA
jgi:RNA polymerase sigma factor (sigma-70 family)